MDISKSFSSCESTTKNLQWLHQTQNEVITITGSGTAAMEAGIINTLSKGDKVICGENGKFGERWVKVAQEFGLDVIEIKANGANLSILKTSKNFRRRSKKNKGCYSNPL